MAHKDNDFITLHSDDGKTSWKVHASMLENNGSKNELRNRKADIQELTNSVIKRLDDKLKNGIKVSQENSMKTPSISKLEEDQFVGQHDLAIGGMQRQFNDYAKKRGISSWDTEDARQLMSRHGGNQHQQKEADEQIIKELESNSSIGKALEARMDFEEYLYSKWLKYNASKEDSWRRGIFDGQKRIYRKGNRVKGVESWTVNEEGADMGHGGIGYDHVSTVDALLREGYRILGGIGLAGGAVGEGEITFVKYKKR